MSLPKPVSRLAALAALHLCASVQKVVDTALHQMGKSDITESCDQGYPPNILRATHGSAVDSSSQQY